MFNCNFISFCLLSEVCVVGNKVSYVFDLILKEVVFFFFRLDASSDKVDQGFKQ